MAIRIIVANRLSDGVVVYLTADGGWTTRIDGAQAAENDAEAEALLTAAERAARRRIVVDPYAIETEDGGRRAVRLRERIRASGPTVRPDLTRDAEAQV